jgi:hypothetical protein
MTMTHYADAAGKYLGAYDELAEKPNGTEVPEPPDGRAIWNGSSWDMSAVAEIERASMSLSFAQLLIGLVTEGWISQAAGEAWLAGTLPAQVTAILSTLPVEQQFAAKARALRPSVVQRMDPLVAALGFATGKTAEQLDTFFMTYSAW